MKKSWPTTSPATAKAALSLFVKHPNPERYRLRKGATEKELVAREGRLKLPIPDELRELLATHDGIRETHVNSGDLLGGTRTLSALRSDFRRQWAELAEDLEGEMPFRFSRRYLVLGTTGGTGHHFALLDLERELDGSHPVLCFDFDDGEELGGFRSLARYLHWVFLSSNGLEFEKLSKLFPERYSEARFKKMMRSADKVERPSF